MENIDVARLLDEIGDILELKDENPFRIRSYRKAARVIRDLPEDVKSLMESGDLRKIPGIGESLAEKIEEIVKTGTCKFYEELKQDPAYQLRPLLGIPGIGPKLAVRLNKELGIKTIEDLEKAARQGNLQNLEGIREKLEEKILKGIEQYKRHIGRFKLSDALTYAESIIRLLSSEKGIIRIDLAGSLRRMKETIGDIDILLIASQEKRKDLMDAFTRIDLVADVLARGDTKSSVILRSGIQVDLRILDAENYGAALHYFTGSKDHNVAIRDRAKRMGLKVSEYGVFDAKTGKQIGGSREEEIFSLVGLEFIEPELRESSGEIEAAESGRLPKLIRLDDIKGDLQMHTDASDGANTIEEMANFAKKMGYKYIAITDHSKAVKVAGGLDENALLKQIEEVQKINRRLSGIEILSGVEVDILPDGRLDIDDNVLSKCDVVVAAVHSRFNMPKEEMTRRIIKGISNRYVSILAHPTGRIINEREPYEVDLEAVIDAARKNRVALELNAYPDRLDLRDVHCRQAKEAGVKIAINTDSHAAVQLPNIRYGVATARRGWLEAEDVINTFGLAKLKRFLSKQG
ncbi:MAG: DNA polymerase/3'-5' exonuclease PolX [bacterium]